MTASKLGLILTAVILAATAVGCGGSNGDPGAKKYSEVKKGATLKTDGIASTGATVTPVQPVPTAPPPAVDCNRPIDVTVDKEVGNKILVFNENSDASYTIKIHSNLGPDFKIDPVTQDTDFNNDLHAGRAKFTKASQDGVNAVYTLAWKPQNLRLTQTTFVKLILKFTNTGSNPVCDVQANAALSLAVQPQSAKTGDAK